MAIQSSFKNMVLCLFVICIVCSTLLAVVYAVTAAPIQAAAEAKTNAASALTAANNAASSANTAKTVASAQAAVVTSDKRALKAPNGGTWYCYVDASYRDATMGEYTDIVKSGKYSGGASIQTANSNIILNSSICVRIA